MAEEQAELDKEKILLSTADATQVARLLRMLVPGGGTASELLKNVKRLQRTDADQCDFDPESLRRIARQMYIRRQARSRYFPADFFREPAWDMLLALYAGSDFDVRQPVSGLLTFSSCPPTTALRHLAALEQSGHVSRRASERDGRVQYIELTVEGQTAMRRYLAAVLACEGT